MYLRMTVNIYVLMFFSSTTDECSNYNVLSAADRAMNYTNRNILKCDKFLTRRWYRFQGAAGIEMPTSCVPHHHCGTHASGWLRGGHPSVVQGVVSRKVCFHWTKTCCEFSSNIRVRNCGGFYVYELEPTPLCHLRYCGNGQGNYRYYCSCSCSCSCCGREK